MGKQRGFKPQGIANPIMLARVNRPVQTGPTIRERLDRADRPSWQDVKAAAQKKEKSSSEFLEKWENQSYQKELEVFRELKRSEQEKGHLDEIARRRGLAAEANADNESDSSSISEKRHHHRAVHIRKHHHNKLSSKSHRRNSKSEEDYMERKDGFSRDHRKRRRHESGSDSDTDDKKSHKRRRRKSESGDRYIKTRKRSHHRKEKRETPYKMSNSMKSSLDH